MHTEELNPEWISTAHTGKQSSGLHADLTGGETGPAQLVWSVHTGASEDA